MTDEQRRHRHSERVKRRKRQLRRRIALVVLLLIVAVAGAVSLLLDTKKPVRDAVAIEAGTAIALSEFLEEPDVAAQFLTDVSLIDTAVPGDYPVVVKAGRKEYNCTLTVRDTVAPTADAVFVTLFSGETVEAADCIKNVKDVTPVTAEFEEEPDFVTGGESTVSIILTDAAGNETKVLTKLTVLTDTQPPVIAGAEDIAAFVGDSISYKANITVTDDYDEKPSLTVDNSSVDLTVAGAYPVTYIATDYSGNTATVTITLTLTEKPEGYVEPEEVYALAQEVYDSIIKDTMSDMQKAFAIYLWTRANIGYTGESDKSDWTIGAYDAFTNLAGDCYNYYAAAKALFDIAGIENIDIVKSDTSHSSHFWSIINLGDGWYHVDCTPRKGDGDNFFMVTDEELEAYSVEHHNSHIFDSSLYPERATESLQDKVDYENGVLNE